MCAIYPGVAVPLLELIIKPSRFSGARAVGRAAVGPHGGARGRVGDARVQGEARQPGAAGHVEEEGERVKGAPRGQTRGGILSVASGNQAKGSVLSSDP